MAIISRSRVDPCTRVLPVSVDNDSMTECDKCGCIDVHSRKDKRKRIRHSKNGKLERHPEPEPHRGLVTGRAGGMLSRHMQGCHHDDERTEWCVCARASNSDVNNDIQYVTQAVTHS